MLAIGIIYNIINIKDSDGRSTTIVVGAHCYSLSAPRRIQQLKSGKVVTRWRTKRLPPDAALLPGLPWLFWKDRRPASRTAAYDEKFAAAISKYSRTHSRPVPDATTSWFRCRCPDAGRAAGMAGACPPVRSAHAAGKGGAGAAELPERGAWGCAPQEPGPDSGAGSRGVSPGGKRNG